MESDAEKDAAFIDAVEVSLGSLVPKYLYDLARRGAAVQSAFTLSPEAYERLVTILDNPAPPTEALKKLFRDYGPYLPPPSGEPRDE